MFEVVDEEVGRTDQCQKKVTEREIEVRSRAKLKDPIHSVGKSLKKSKSTTFASEASFIYIQNLCILNAGDKSGRTALIGACNKGHIDHSGSKNIDLNAKDQSE